MRTAFRTEENYQALAYQFVETTPCIGPVLPLRFQEKMWKNRSAISMFSPFPPPEDGLDAKNPLIVALGDSVTAGHFEFAKSREEMEKDPVYRPTDIGEIIDVEEGYVDRFRSKLIHHYHHQTAVSVINSGLAGDSILGMQRRLDRDVLRYQPDLVLINAVLNWPETCGENDDYRAALDAVVYRVKHETQADVVLLTPNAMTPSPFEHPRSSLDQRVEIVREVAARHEVCLVDTYKIWKAYEAAGHPVAALLANGCNHPSTTGHEIYARALMKLFPVDPYTAGK